MSEQTPYRPESRPPSEDFPPCDASVPEEKRIRPRVLLVEDNVINQRVAGIILDRLGYSVDIAKDGAAALELVGRFRFDAVLMDCQLPGLNGLDTTRLIRLLPGDEARTPIIALTAHAGSRDRKRCLRAGMDDYLVKPFKAELIKEMLDRWIARPT